MVKRLRPHILHVAYPCTLYSIFNENLNYSKRMDVLHRLRQDDMEMRRLIRKLLDRAFVLENPRRSRLWEMFATWASSPALCSASLTQAPTAAPRSMASRSSSPLSSSPTYQALPPRSTSASRRPSGCAQCQCRAGTRGHPRSTLRSWSMPFSTSTMITSDTRTSLGFLYIKLWLLFKTRSRPGRLGPHRDDA